MPKIRPRPDRARPINSESLVYEHICDCGKHSFIEFVREVEQYQAYIYGPEKKDIPLITLPKKLNHPFTVAPVV